MITYDCKPLSASRPETTRTEKPLIHAADGQYLVAGPVLNQQGQDAAHADMIKLGLIPKPASAAVLAEKRKTAANSTKC